MDGNAADIIYTLCRHSTSGTCGRSSALVGSGADERHMDAALAWCCLRLSQLEQRRGCLKILPDSEDGKDIASASASSGCGEKRRRREATASVAKGKARCSSFSSLYSSTLTQTHSSLIVALLEAGALQHATLRTWLWTRAGAGAPCGECLTRYAQLLSVRGRGEGGRPQRGVRQREACPDCCDFKSSCEAGCRAFFESTPQVSAFVQALLLPAPQSFCSSGYRPTFAAASARPCTCSPPCLPRLPPLLALYALLTSKKRRERLFSHLVMPAAMKLQDGKNMEEVTVRVHAQLEMRKGNDEDDHDVCCQSPSSSHPFYYYSRRLECWAASLLWCHSAQEGQPHAKTVFVLPPLSSLSYPAAAMADATASGGECGTDALSGLRSCTADLLPCRFEQYLHEAVTFPLVGLSTTSSIITAMNTNTLATSTAAATTNAEGTSYTEVFARVYRRLREDSHGTYEGAMTALMCAWAMYVQENSQQRETNEGGEVVESASIERGLAASLRAMERYPAAAIVGERSDSSTDSRRESGSTGVQQAEGTEGQESDTVAVLLGHVAWAGLLAVVGLGEGLAAQYVRCSLTPVEEGLVHPRLMEAMFAGLPVLARSAAAADSSSSVERGCSCAEARSSSTSTSTTTAAAAAAALVDLVDLTFTPPFFRPTLDDLLSAAPQQSTGVTPGSSSHVSPWVACRLASPAAVTSIALRHPRAQLRMLENVWRLSTSAALGEEEEEEKKSHHTSPCLFSAGVGGAERTEGLALLLGTLYDVYGYSSAMGGIPCETSFATHEPATAPAVSAPAPSVALAGNQGESSTHGASDDMTASTTAEEIHGTQRNVVVEGRSITRIEALKTTVKTEGGQEPVEDDGQLAPATAVGHFIREELLPPQQRQEEEEASFTTVNTTAGGSNMTEKVVKENKRKHISSTLHGSTATTAEAAREEEEEEGTLQQQQHQQQEQPVVPVAPRPRLVLRLKPRGDEKEQQQEERVAKGSSGMSGGAPRINSSSSSSSFASVITPAAVRIEKRMRDDPLQPQAQRKQEAKPPSLLRDLNTPPMLSFTSTTTPAILATAGGSTAALSAAMTSALVELSKAFARSLLTKAAVLATAERCSQSSRDGEEGLAASSLTSLFRSSAATGAARSGLSLLPPTYGRACYALLQGGRQSRRSNSNKKGRSTPVCGAVQGERNNNNNGHDDNDDEGGEFDVVDTTHRALCATLGASTCYLLCRWLLHVLALASVESTGSFPSSSPGGNLGAGVDDEQHTGVTPATRAAVLETQEESYQVLCAGITHFVTIVRPLLRFWPAERRAYLRYTPVRSVLLPCIVGRLEAAAAAAKGLEGIGKERATHMRNALSELISLLRTYEMVE